MEHMNESKATVQSTIDLASLLDHAVSKTERVKVSPVVDTKPTPTLTNPKTPYQGAPVEKVASDLRKILKHFKYGMTSAEKAKFAKLIQAQSHCESGMAAQIGKVLESKSK